MTCESHMRLEFEHPQVELCWDATRLICLHIVYICFYTSVVALSSCDRDCMALKN